MELQPPSWWVYVQYLLIPLTIAVAVLGQAKPGHGVPPEATTWGVVARLLLAVASLSLGLACTIRAKGHRWFAASLWLFQLRLMQGAIVISGMAVTGDWI